MYKKILLLSLFLLSSVVGASPREIIIVRHGDKLVGPTKSHDYTGRYLSAKGQVRAEKLAVYYMAHFPKPDFIFATKPADSKAAHESTSYRPLQTVMPLANLLTAQGGGDVIIHTPYYEKDYGKLASHLLMDKKYDQQFILICWQHERINLMAQALGVTESLPKWQGKDYDQVYILKYDAKGKLRSFQILKNQYPVNGDPAWEQLAKISL